MWRFFERHPRGTVTASFIEKYSSRMADNVTDTPPVARASHGKPTVEPLGRTALRLLKRAGRPELNEHYARIRENLAATRVDD